jgi:hypothetical protein
MQKKEIRISVIDIDNEEIQFKIELTNGINSTFLNFYGYADDYKIFAEGLISFPKSISDTVIFEIGEDTPKWAYYLFLKVFCYETNGRSAIYIKVYNHADPPNTYMSEFYISTLPASLNKLGQHLLDWNPKIEKDFFWIAE